ncbi:MAG: hypothetical protein PHH67_02065 [Methanosarcina sp.]|jgi:hypothetical protein|nr:hypothetical protein [Methanosarcina sp.]MDD4305290.1 hypothetical protein [Methanosarcina sp.]MDD4619827.1 hypothetical protein [Methanosarcina sp.]NLN43642.1 hypothetical protein [Methanosarcina sp.]
MNFIDRFILKVKKIMPLESLLFFLHYIWFAVFLLTIFGDIVALVMTPGLFVLFFVPIVSIGQNIVQNKNDVRKVLCCVPLLIAGAYQTITAVAGYTRVMNYGSHPDSLLYALLFPIRKLVETVIYPITGKIFYMGFPYNQLPDAIFYIVILPASLFIYLLPTVDYDKAKITKEMKLIALLPLLCVAIPVIVQTVKMRLGLIDELMIQFFWAEIVSNIQLMGFFLLMPALSILYIIHYHRVVR